MSKKLKIVDKHISKKEAIRKLKNYKMKLQNEVCDSVQISQYNQGKMDALDEALKIMELIYEFGENKQ